jgi:hypothetical protein
MRSIDQQISAMESMSRDRNQLLLIERRKVERRLSILHLQAHTLSFLFLVPFIFLQFSSSSSLFIFSVSVPLSLCLSVSLSVCLSLFLMAGQSRRPQGEASISQQRKPRD